MCCNYRSGIGLLTGHPFSMAIGPSIGHVRTCHSHGAEVTVTVLSTTVRLTIKSSIDLVTVGRTMMEASLA